MNIETTVKTTVECKDCGRVFVYDSEKGLRAYCEHVCKTIKKEEN